jgi:WD40 repeat protein
MAENLREQDFVLFKSSEDRDLDFLVSSESQEIIPRIIRDYDFVQFLDEYTIAGTKNDSRVRRADKEIVLLNLPHGDYLRSITSQGIYISVDKEYDHKPADWEISDDGSILVCFTHGDIFDKYEIPCIASFWRLSDLKHLVNITVNISRHDCLAENFPTIRININQKIIFSSYSNTINFWSLSNGNHLKTITTNLLGWRSTMVSSDKYLATAELSLSSTSSIKLWSLPDGNLLKTFPDIQVRALTISPDGKFLAAVSVNRIRIWSLPDGNEMKLLEDDTSYEVYSIAISPDAKILASGSADLASGSWDGTIRLWSFPDGKHLKTLKNPTKHKDEFLMKFKVDSVAINQNGRALVSNSSDGTMRIWTSPNSPISKLTPRDITEIERKTKDSSLEEGTRNAFKFTLALIRLRQQFDIDIEESSNDISSSEYDIEIE